MSRMGKWRKPFLRALAKTGTIKAACKLAKVRRQLAYEVRERDEQFAKEWLDALEDFKDSLEEVAVERARRKSDILLIKLLQANLPEKYKDRVEVRERKVLVCDVGPSPATP